MAKIVIDCADPNDFTKVVESAEKAAGSCTITYAKQHLEMVKAGTSGSVRESGRIISEDSDESEDAARMKIHRGLNKMEHDVPQKSKPPETIEDTTPEIIKDRHPQGGGRREGAGRPPKPRPTLSEKEKIIDAEFQEGFNLLFRAIKNAKHSKWTLTSKEAALKHIEILYNVITIT